MKSWDTCGELERKGGLRAAEDRNVKSGIVLKIDNVAYSYLSPLSRSGND